MNKLVITILCICAGYLLSFSQSTNYFDARVETAGTLAEVLGDRANEIDSLTVYGPINDADFETIWSCSFDGKLAALNLENATVTNGVIPKNALWKPGKQVIDVYVIPLLLRRILLPDNITEIGEEAFCYMVNLVDINMPASLTTIGMSAFYECVKLCPDQLLIPEGVKKIPHQCFKGCKNLKEVLLPSTIKTIGSFSFDNSGITSINFPEGLERIEMNAFNNCLSLTGINLPSTCLTIEQNAFHLCVAAKSLTLPEGIEVISESAFSGCLALEEVVVPNSVTAIETSAFSACSSLKYVTLSEQLKTLGSSAFNGCAIERIILPSSLESIGVSCFSSPLTEIYCKGTVPSEWVDYNNDVNKTPFAGIARTIPVYVPVGCSATYLGDADWSYFWNIIELAEFPETGIDDAQTTKSEYKVYGRDGQIVIEKPADFSKSADYKVYSIDGIVVEQGKMTDTLIALSVPNGVYIVRIGQSVYKVKA